MFIVTVIISTGTINLVAELLRVDYWNNKWDIIFKNSINLFFSNPHGIGTMYVDF